MFVLFLQAVGIPRATFPPTSADETVEDCSSSESIPVTGDVRKTVEKNLRKTAENVRKCVENVSKNVEKHIGKNVEKAPMEVPQKNDNVVAVQPTEEKKILLPEPVKVPSKISKVRFFLQD